ncbi:hypothetical protein KP509_25G019600 [Ceratopteris richardii]|uniref:BI1-like protein n=1 Tax=Ceratopteris richardii TaxID=49495 RepID=A0A8T2RQ64_CERRI|nr:hypothetical protein KP509_25G019600 [Ceratopteris richardii]
MFDVREMIGRGKEDHLYDEEAAVLYPGLSADESQLRWGLIRKVYGILGTQLLLTSIVAGIVVLCRPVSAFLLNSPVLVFFIAIAPFIVMVPMYFYRQKHPVNLLLLALFTIVLSLSVGFSCAFTSGEIVLEALILTAVVVLSLTAYTFWASRKGYDFSFMGPFLFTSLIILCVFGFVQIFFPLGPLSSMIYGGLGALLFCGYIIYDTSNLIKIYSYDEYLWASVVLYLDILNLFLMLMDMLKGNR